MNKPAHPRVFERLFVVASMLVFFRAFIYLFLTDASRGPGNSVGQMTANHSAILAIYIFIYCVTAVLLARHWRALLELAYREKLLSILLALAFFSMLWSAAPQMTLARSFAMSGTTLFGVYFALRFSPSEQVKLLAWAAIIAIGCSYATVIGFPEAGLMKGTHEALWRGVFIHKNLLALVLPLGSVSLYILAVSALRWRHWYWCWFWLALLLLALTGSKSSLLGYMALFFGIAVYLALAGQRKLMIPVLISVLLAGASLTAQVGYNVFPSAVYAEIRSQLADTGVDPASGEHKTLRSRFDELLSRIRVAAPESANPEGLASASGRLHLWRELWVLHHAKPWLGYGFGGFWLETSGPSKEVWQKLKWKPRAAHNGYLELLIELGLTGLVLFGAGFCLALYRAMRQLPMTSFEPVRLYFPALLVYLLLANIGESALFGPNLFTWVCYVAAVVSLLVPPTGETDAGE